MRLIDWEYAGMCDPLIDVAMCAIYSYYNENELDWLLRTYLEREPDQKEWLVVYSYAGGISLELVGSLQKQGRRRVRRVHPDHVPVCKGLL